MRVIFLEDVPNVASAGETKEVADGYGRNFLIPKKLALLADSPDATLIAAQRQAIEKKTDEELTGLAQQLEGKEITIKAKAGAKDRLYGSITSADIAAELENATGLAIDKRKIELAEPIHQLGSYEVAIRLGKGIVPQIKVTITAEEEEKKAEKKVAKKAEKKVVKKAEKKVAKKAEKKVVKKAVKKVVKKAEKKVVKKAVKKVVKKAEKKVVKKAVKEKRE
jgi:large subunit ribosomal protein L9